MEEIHFNLMAIVSSRKSIHLKGIDRLNQRKTQIVDKVCKGYLLPFEAQNYTLETCKMQAFWGVWESEHKSI